MLEAIPLFAMLKSKLGYDSQREKLIGENVANSDTPGYAPRDLKAFSFDTSLSGAMSAGVAPARTNAMHLSGRSRPAGAMKPQKAPDSEARLDGNQVVLEEQMVKLNDTQGDYTTALSLYEQSLGMLRTAMKEPGK